MPRRRRTRRWEQASPRRETSRSQSSIEIAETVDSSCHAWRSPPAMDEARIDLVRSSRRPRVPERRSTHHGTIRVGETASCRGERLPRLPRSLPLGKRFPMTDQSREGLGCSPNSGALQRQKSADLAPPIRTGRCAQTPKSNCVSSTACVRFGSQFQPRSWWPLGRAPAPHQTAMPADLRQCLRPCGGPRPEHAVQI